MKRILYLVSLLTLFNCSTKEKATQSGGVDTTAVNPGPSRPQPDPISSTERSAPKGAPANAGKWLYSRSTDNVGNPVYKASVIASNLLEFPFPYEGGSSATLTIRKRSTGTNVYLEVSKGQFNRSFQGGSAQIRFDNKPAVAFAFSAAENGRANIIFFDADQKLISQLKTSRNTIIDVGFDGQGAREIQFKTAGLNWTH